MGAFDYVYIVIGRFFGGSDHSGRDFRGIFGGFGIAAAVDDEED